jgi:hypothetical protein
MPAGTVDAVDGAPLIVDSAVSPPQSTAAITSHAASCSPCIAFKL